MFFVKIIFEYHIAFIFYMYIFTFALKISPLEV